MRLTIFGSGYVGLVTGACMAETGNHVVCVDIDEGKIERLKAGDIPIYEPGLDAYMERNVEAGRLEFTTDIEKGVGHGLFQFIAVGTPPDEDGSADLQYVLAVARSIGENMNDYRIVVDPGTSAATRFAAEELRQMGYNVQEREGENSGLHVILVTEDGLEGGADPRRGAGQGAARGPGRRWCR